MLSFLLENRPLKPILITKFFNHLHPGDYCRLNTVDHNYLLSFIAYSFYFNSLTAQFDWIHSNLANDIDDEGPGSFLHVRRQLEEEVLQERNDKLLEEYLELA